MTSAKWRAGSRGRIDPGRLDLGRVVLALDRPEGGPGLVGAQPPSGVLGKQTFDDRAQRAGAQERGRPARTAVRVASSEPLSKGGLPSTAVNSVAPSENKSQAGPESPLSSRSGETYAGVPGNVPAAGEASSMVPVQQFVIGEPDPAHAAAAQQRPQPETPGDQVAAGLAGPAAGQLFRDGRMPLASGAPPAPSAARAPASQLQEGLHTG